VAWPFVHSLQVVDAGMDEVKKPMGVGDLELRKLKGAAANAVPPLQLMRCMIRACDSMGRVVCHDGDIRVVRWVPCETYV
jgi:hypothetical protein